MIHSNHGASSAHRWLACPGSLKQAALIPPGMRREQSDAAAEGSAAHAFAEDCLRHEKDPTSFLGQWISPNGKYAAEEKAGYWEIDSDMVEAVLLYRQTLREHMKGLTDPRLFLEQTVHPLPERTDVFGTADALIVEPYGTLVCADFKYGKGVIVEPDWNDQMMFYALGSLNRVGDDSEVAKIVCIVVQPRAPHEAGPVRVWETSVEELRAFQSVLRGGLAATEGPNPPLISGDHCRWCPAKMAAPGGLPMCPALRESHLAHVVSDFDAVEPEVRLPNPNDPAQLARALKLVDLLESWCRDVPTLALRAAEMGANIPGWKLVRKGTHRRWAREADVERALDEAGIPESVSHVPPKLKSPAQLEKIMTRGWVEEYVTKPEGALVLVPDSDKRPAEQPTLLADFGEDPTEGE